jgi:hypothetical protein
VQTGLYAPLKRWGFVSYALSYVTWVLCAGSHRQGRGLTAGCTSDAQREEPATALERVWVTRSSGWGTSSVEARPTAPTVLGESPEIRATARPCSVARSYNSASLGYATRSRPGCADYRVLTTYGPSLCSGTSCAGLGSHSRAGERSLCQSPLGLNLTEK